MSKLVKEKSIQPEGSQIKKVEIYRKDEEYEVIVQFINSKELVSSENPNVGKIN